MPTVTVSSKGQIVMPKKIRDALGIKPRQKVFVKVVQNHAEIIPLPENPAQAFCGIFKNGSSLTETLLQGRREETRLEEKNIARFLRAPGISKKRR
ncbi:AbrB/MazE/SpoVT family DNA-binding domain-containing protein [Thermodesulfovibrionales bacterium]|nr:AbrB/MazE/SpoVT family DNA-binding domain-containing protein [Thermodesulfovibrionales bacterium]MCL0047334.1 AbrB/MazE/SpoVT family DNA-binding domain-containing protein [Thermodesulfovibrionales bacterium]MCL0096344.1 AbrB/MazE/SpoVT family DNA-binding domain-containing protein [Thermodesulfovibrionales bacterium]